MTYYRDQISRLATAPTYAVKIQTRGAPVTVGDQNTTKWFRVTPDQMRRIADIVAEEGHRVPATLRPHGGVD